MKIIECREHEQIAIPIDELFSGGEIVLDERVAKKGYLDVSFQGQRLFLKSTRFVGLIPLNQNISVRILPKARIANLSKMIVRCGEIPDMLPDFSRGYNPNFIASGRVEEIYHQSYLKAVGKLVQRGLYKSYQSVANPPMWRGRLLVAPTVARYVARGIRYQGVFDFRTLTVDVPENIVIKAALRAIQDWIYQTKPRDNLLQQANGLIEAFGMVSDWEGPLGELLAAVVWRINRLPVHVNYYNEPLWTAYAILQGIIPDIDAEGFVNLDSMIVDISSIFENYARKILSENILSDEYSVRDGNKHPTEFFIDSDKYSVHPDIIVLRSGVATAILDVKYKPKLSTADRYEVLSFMEAFGAQRAAFVCPTVTGTETSHYLGKTGSGKEMSLLRIDLAAADLDQEEAKFRMNVMRFLEGDYSFS